MSCEALLLVKLTITIFVRLATPKVLEGGKTYVFLFSLVIVFEETQISIQWIWGLNENRIAKAYQ